MSPQINIKIAGSSDEMTSQVKIYAELHSMLNDITEIINLCYSKQVIYRIEEIFYMPRVSKVIFPSACRSENVIFVPEACKNIFLSKISRILF